MNEIGMDSRTLRELLEAGHPDRAEQMLAEIHPADLGVVLADLTQEETRAVIDLLFAQRRAASMLAELPSELLPQVFEALTDQRISELLTRLEIDDMLLLMDHVPDERREKIQQWLPQDKRHELRHAELYPPESAGRVMTTNLLALDQKTTAQQAINSIRSAGDSKEAVLYLYVVDGEKCLLGVVPIRRLVAAPPETPMAQLMTPASISSDPSGT